MEEGHWGWGDIVRMVAVLASWRIENGWRIVKGWKIELGENLVLALVGKLMMKPSREVERWLKIWQVEVVEQSHRQKNCCY